MPRVEPPSDAGEREEQLAVNLWDLDRIDGDTRRELLGGRLAPGAAPIDLRDRFGAEDVAVVLACPLLEAAIVCDLLRNADRALNDSPTRVYILAPGRPWARLPGTAVLTRPDGTLNHELFPTKVEAAAVNAAAPPPRHVTLGRR
jgi:hypothetical protein